MRTKYTHVLWANLGQTPQIGKLMELLHRQLTGTPFPDNLGLGERKEVLRQAMKAKPLLLVVRHLPTPLLPVVSACWLSLAVRAVSWTTFGSKLMRPASTSWTQWRAAGR